MKLYEWDQIVEDSASGKLSKEQMQAAIANANHIIQFVRDQVKYGRATQHWQRAALDNINQRLE